MRVLIDMVGCQTFSAVHDTEHHFIELIKKIVRQANHNEVILLLSNGFPESINAIRTLFAGLIPAGNIYIYDSLTNVNSQAENKSRRYAMEVIREGVIAKLNPDLLLITSSFEEGNDNAVVSIGNLPFSVPTAVMAYDPNVLVNKDRQITNWHVNPLTYFQRADLILVLSEQTERNVIDYLNIAPEKIKNITLNGDGFLNLETEEGKKKAGENVWNALISLFKEKPKTPVSNPVLTKKRLAYLSPLPPLKSGISKYSAELLPELAKYYDVDVIVNQPEIDDPWINSNCQVRDVAWLREHSYLYDRVLYHFGNSQFHAYMIPLLADIPGIVVMHEYHLSDLIAYSATLSREATYRWLYAFLNTHGWKPVYQYFSLSDENKYNFTFGYPSNQEILQHALGIIVHSDYSRKLANNYYGFDVAKDWTQIPLLRIPAAKVSKKEARKKLGINENAFIVCSFGLLGATKLNDRLLSAWLSSSLANKPNCHLIFVGDVAGCKYSDEIVNKINNDRAENNIRVTGWVDDETYNDWLNAADVGVQLRAMSLGETSAAVLDCMNHGLATIVNANGSMADLPSDAVCIMPDKFSDEQLTELLTKLYEDDNYRQTLSKNASEIIKSVHQPESCAEQYAQAIEDFYSRADSQMLGVIKRLTQLPFAQHELAEVANVIATNFPPAPRRKKLFVDITVLTIVDSKTGIQRVVKAILKKLLLNPPEPYDVQPVYICPDGLGYKYARKFTCNFLGIDDSWVEDEVLDVVNGDIFLGLDLNMAYIAAEKESLTRLHQLGLKVYFVVYDLLPILIPETFYDHMEQSYQQWIEMIVKFDGAICISKAVANELSEWLINHCPEKESSFKIDWFNLGADIDDALPSVGIPENAADLLSKLKSKVSFLMVGTVEPRKCHQQVLHGFEMLWDQGVDANLVIVGKRGWLTESLVEEIENHPQLNSKLFWLEQCSDEYLEKIYEVSTCLIAASKGEGFGLPIIEAITHKLSVIARDIPVFREVTEDGAFYFTGFEPADLAQAVKCWLALFNQGKAPCSEEISWLTWEQSAEQLLDVLLNKFEDQPILREE